MAKADDIEHYCRMIRAHEEEDQPFRHGIGLLHSAPGILNNMSCHWVTT